ncbi:HEPN domain-containing protein, partial [Rossellomorea marisflavi]|uniref:HEPN domain-containing protein n=1 Tax=Rossellomorea marisflavi TaxID=189381 RepID=UPI00295F19D1
IDASLNRGISIGSGTRITNSMEVKESFVETALFKTTIGVHSIEEFIDGVYLYRKGEMEFGNEEEINNIGTNLAFYYLREAQYFLRDLWGIKDNSTYVRDGFLVFYHQEIEDGLTYKASVSAIYTNARALRGYTTFSREEISAAAKIYNESKSEKFDGSDKYKIPQFNHFYKKKSPGRMTSAEYFTLSARSNPAIPMKIVLYCTALESLFSTDTSEVGHKVGERVAMLLGTSSEHKNSLYKFFKNAYSQRSAIVHGSTVRKSESELADISQELDGILRELLVEQHEVFLKSPGEIDDFFLNLLLT